MAIPEGYERLAVIGIAYKGDYDAGITYSQMSAVYYNGCTYVAIKDAPTSPPAADGANWQYLAKGFLEGVLSAVEAVDTSGVLGDAGATVGGQALIDAIADRVMTKLVSKTQIVNNLLATTPGNVLDAMQGKALGDMVAQLNSGLAGKVQIANKAFQLTIPAQGHTYIDVTLPIPSGYQFGIAMLSGGESRHVAGLSLILVSAASSNVVLSVTGDSTFTSPLTVTGSIVAMFYL